MKSLILLAVAGAQFHAVARAQRDDHVLHAGIAHVQHMGMALRAVADDGHLLALDEIDIGIPIVIDAHFLGSPWVFSAAWGGKIRFAGAW